jgi:hypothetical protein
MPVNKHAQQQETSALRKFDQKAAGTRFGVLIDWREGSNRSGTSGRRGLALRDGR